MPQHLQILATPLLPLFVFLLILLCLIVVGVRKSIVHRSFATKDKIENIGTIEVKHYQHDFIVNQGLRDKTKTTIE